MGSTTSKPSEELARTQNRGVSMLNSKQEKSVQKVPLSQRNLRSNRPANKEAFNTHPTRQEPAPRYGGSSTSPAARAASAAALARADARGIGDMRARSSNTKLTAIREGSEREISRSLTGERTYRTSRNREPEEYSEASSSDSDSEYPGYRQPSVPRPRERNDSRLGRGVKMITVEVPKDEWLEFQEFRRSKNAQKTVSGFDRSA